MWDILWIQTVWHSDGIMKELLKKTILKKISRWQKAWKICPACKELNPLTVRQTSLRTTFHWTAIPLYIHGGQGVSLKLFQMAAEVETAIRFLDFMLPVGFYYVPTTLLLCYCCPGRRILFRCQYTSAALEFSKALLLRSHYNNEDQATLRCSCNLITT